MKTSVVVITFLGIVAIVAAIPFSQEHNDFRNWMLKYNKIYESEEEFRHRLGVFQQNMERIAELNSKSTHPNHAKFGATKFADLTPEEFEKLYLSRPVSDHEMPEAETNLIHSSEPLPSFVDWRQSGCVSDVKNQGACGACWAFGVTECVESVYCLATKKLYELSPQQLVSCEEDSHGCAGGIFASAFYYVKKNGMTEESTYPYTSGAKGQRGECLDYKPVASITSYGIANSHFNETAMQVTVSQKGPIAVEIAATAMQLYTGGIFSGCTETDTNHIVQVVGYSTEDPENPYWIVRNTWGPEWGEGGYIRVAMFKNMCLIAKNGLYAEYKP